MRKMAPISVLDLPLEITTNVSTVAPLPLVFRPSLTRSSQVFSFLEAADVVAYGLTCSKAHRLIIPSEERNTLWKGVFLNSYDDPAHSREALPETARKPYKDLDKEWDWYARLRERKGITRLINSDKPVSFKEDYTEAVRILLDIIETAKTGPTKAELARGIRRQIDDRQSRNLDVLAQLSYSGRRNLERIIHARHLETLIDVQPRSYGRPVTRSTSVIQQPDSLARLHLLFGMTEMEQNNAPRLQGHGRRLVYDWSLTGPSTDYGPFNLNGSGKVNWQLLEGICSTISRNFYRCADGRIIMPEGFHYSIPYRTLDDPTVPEDWAGAQGAWLGTYAFLDYADLYQFNIGHRPGQRPNLEDEPEACGDLMRLELRLNPKLKTDPKLNTKIPICEDKPMLYFSGESKGHDGAHRPTIQVRGSVSLVPGGREVRWRYLIK